jgi:hypothetical protein
MHVFGDRNVVPGAALVGSPDFSEATVFHLLSFPWLCPRFNCLTCGLIDDAGLCKYCMESHHAGHDLVAKPAKLFYCDCGARGLCGALPAPGVPILPAGGSSKASSASSEDDTSLCCVCVDASKDTLLSHGDHGHLCVCFPCGKSLQARGSACPVCRQVILAVTKVYV